MKKFNLTLAIEVAGVACATVGIAMLSIPFALIALGGFLVWIIEKAN
jgi:hypothetical protein